MSHKFNPAAITCLVFLIAAASATAAFNEYSMLFDGANEYIDCSNVLNFERTDTFSFSVWVKRDVSKLQIILGKDDPASSYNGYGIFLQTDNKFYIDLINVFATSRISVYCNDITVGTNWTHILFTYDGSSLASGIKIYIDNVLGANVVVADNLSGSIIASDNLKIGAIRPSNDYPFNGNIDEVSVWNKTLSSNEVSEIYNNGYPGNLANHSAQTNLVSWWRMGDGDTYSGGVWTINDQKGTNTGTSVNMEEADRSTEVPPAPPVPSGTTFMAR